eukprot:UN11071
MIKLINKRKNIKDIDVDENKDSDVGKSFGERLFDFFCENGCMTFVHIRNFEKIPVSFKNVLLKMNNTNEIELLSFYGLMVVFPNCTKIILNDLNLKVFTKNCENYVKSVTKYIEYVKGNEGDKDITDPLCEIIFESSETNDGKQNSPLRKLAIKNRSLYKKKLQWMFVYEFDERSHWIIFQKY